MEDGQSEENQDHVREPGVQGGEMKSLRYMVDVKELKDVEVEEIQAVAALTDKEKGAPGEDCRDRVRAAETENEGTKDGGHEAAVHQEVGGAKTGVMRPPCIRR